eukprot:463957-Pleurochrysis_carterae.AAC.1
MSRTVSEIEQLLPAIFRKCQAVGIGVGRNTPTGGSRAHAISLLLARGSLVALGGRRVRTSKPEFTAAGCTSRTMGVALRER